MGNAKIKDRKKYLTLFYFILYFDKSLHDLMVSLEWTQPSVCQPLDASDWMVTLTSTCFPCGRRRGGHVIAALVCF